MRDVGGEAVGAVVETDFGQARHRRGLHFAVLADWRPETKRMAAAALHRQHDVLQQRHRHHHAGNLERTRQTLTRSPGGAVAGNAVAAELDFAAVGPDLPGQLGDQSGLSGAVGPDYGVDQAPVDRQVDVIGRDDAAKVLVQVTDLQQRISHAHPSFDRAG